MTNLANVNNVTLLTAARKAKRNTGYKRLSLNKYDKLDDALKATRNEIERIKRIVARHSDHGDATVQKLDRFWNQVEAVRWDLAQRKMRDYSKNQLAMHYARNMASDA